MMNEIAERYAQGLFELAKENGTLSAKKEQCRQIEDVIDRNREVELFLRAVKITKDEKKAFIREILSQVADIDFINLISLLIDRGRTAYLPQILAEFEKIVNEELGIIKAIVHSARKLSDEDMRKIEQALMQKTRKTVLLENQVDPQLIAGIKVTVGNTVTDITMKTKIEHMKNVLMKGGQA